MQPNAPSMIHRNVFFLLLCLEVGGAGGFCGMCVCIHFEIVHKTKKVNMNTRNKIL